jgi:hypothetical protein
MATRTNSFPNSFICKTYSLPQLLTPSESSKQSHFLVTRVPPRSADETKTCSPSAISLSSKTGNDLRITLYRKLKEASPSKNTVEDFSNKLNLISKLHQKSAEERMILNDLNTKRSKIQASRTSMHKLHKSDMKANYSVSTLKVLYDKSTAVTPLKERLPIIEEGRKARSVDRKKNKARLNRLVLSPDVIPLTSQRRVYTIEDLRIIYNTRSPKPFRFDL